MLVRQNKHPINPMLDPQAPNNWVDSMWSHTVATVLDLRNMKTTIFFMKLQSCYTSTR